MAHVRPVPIWGLINFFNNFDYCSQKKSTQGGLTPPQEVADPPESSAEPLWGSTLTP